jgi:hypothetical protein
MQRHSAGDAPAPAGPPYRLSPFQRRLVLAACPAGAAVAGARYVRDGNFPCPVRVDVRLRGGADAAVLLRLDRFPELVEREARLLPHLARAGLPVAEVLAGPASDPAAPAAGAMAVYSVLPGEHLLRRIYRASAAEKPALADQLLEAVDRVQALTPRLAALLAGAGETDLLPHRGLADELRAAGAGPAAAAGPQLARALAVVAPLAAQEEAGPSFWSGDSNPANFLSDGHRVTGFVDFAHACWHDPHYGLARFTVYHWVHLDRPALFARYRERHGLSERDFALRSAVHCLTLLLRSAPGAPVHAARREEVGAQLDADLRRLAAA